MGCHPDARCQPPAFAGRSHGICKGHNSKPHAGPRPSGAHNLLYTDTLPAKETTDDESSSSFSSGDSEAGSEAEGHLHKLITIARFTLLAAGTSRAARVHEIHSDDINFAARVKLACGRSLRRSTTQVLIAEEFKFGQKKPCEDSMRNWHDSITSLFAPHA